MLLFIISDADGETEAWKTWVSSKHHQLVSGGTGSPPQTGWSQALSYSLPTPPLSARPPEEGEAEPWGRPPTQLREAEELVLVLRGVVHVELCHLQPVHRGFAQKGAVGTCSRM